MIAYGRYGGICSKQIQPPLEGVAKDSLQAEAKGRLNEHESAKFQERLALLKKQVETSDGKIGWVYGKYLDVEE